MSNCSLSDAGKEEARLWLQTAVGDTAVDFRDGQWEAISGLVNDGQRLLVVQSTGWGKSIVYFIAARILRQRHRRLTLIVSPLISLMRNQILQAERIGVNAVTINYSTKDDWEQHRNAIFDDTVDVILISPERLANDEFVRTVLEPMAERIGLIVVDEAHCISVWGHDFRPDYKRLPDVMALLPADVSVLCTTATATNKVVEDITDQFGGKFHIQRGSLLRRSLALQNLVFEDIASRLAWLAENIPRLPGSGVVYVLRRSDADQTADWLQSRRIDARAYYANVLPNDDCNADSDAYRKELEELLLGNRIKVLVTTIALGMGFDKPDIGFVIHFQAPSSVVAYYQQVGRAGRAVPNAYGVLMFGEDDGDFHEHCRDTAFPDKYDINDILLALANSESGLTEEQIQDKCNVRPRDICQALRHLAADKRFHSDGIVLRIGDRWLVRGRELAAYYQLDTEQIGQVKRRKLKEWNELKDYVMIPKSVCLMTRLRSLLDDTTLSEPERCGKCSHCDGKPIIPDTFEPKLAQQAISYLKHSKKTFVCKTEAPNDQLFIACQLPKMIPPALQAKPGRVLAYWMDAGWGPEIFEGKKNNHFGDELVDALADMILDKWKLWELHENNGWVTCVPSTRHQVLVPDFARRLAGRLKLPFCENVGKKHHHKPQKSQKNNYHRCRNLDGTFTVKGKEFTLAVNNKELFSGPVLLVDDIVRSTWTVTVIAALLRQAGSGPVFPVGLARIGTED